MNILHKLTCSAVLACTSLAAHADHSGLPELNLDVSHITLSGLSSGGFMANQMHVAHSDWVSGVGLIAAGPYYCAQNNLLTALASCINKMDKPIGFDTISDQIQEWEKDGKIAPTHHLKNDKVWLLSGTEDTRVIQHVVDGLEKQYSQWGSSVTYINDKPFAHHFPTIETGSVCSQSESPFLGKCDYDAAGEMLKYINAVSADKTKAIQENLHSFNQVVLGGEQAKGLGEKGYIYIPSSCKSGKECKVHISFHGCNQFANAVGDAYVTQTGLNDWAESNNLVVLYPQTKASALAPLNPQGCWDWWGYTDENYATQESTQIQAVKNMITHLSKEEK